MLAPFLLLALAPLASSGVVPGPVPSVIAGFTVAPFAVVPVPTAIAFGGGDADGPDLYAATLLNGVVRVPLLWTPAGVPVATGPFEDVPGDFQSPLGIIFGPDGAMYVADSHDGPESGQTDGRVWRVADGEASVIVDGLPQGQHNVNHLRFGPDGRLYMPNGNPNDHGNGTGTGHSDLFPYSGAILSVDVNDVVGSPAILHYEDANGNAIAFDDIPEHARNADFGAKVNVLAYGLRNIFGVAFSPAGVAYTGMNGADSPSSQDALFRITPGTNYGFPFCYNVGLPGAVGDDVSAASAPDSPNPAYRCAGREAATALLGWHTCATGIDFPTEGAWGFRDDVTARWRSSVYVGECAFFFPESEKILEHPDAAHHSTSHKVVRVELDDEGHAVAVDDFITGLALPTDVLFGPDGAMYVADAEGVTRVAPVLPMGEADKRCNRWVTDGDTDTPWQYECTFRCEPGDELVVAGIGPFATRVEAFCGGVSVYCLGGTACSQRSDRLVQFEERGRCIISGGGQTGSCRAE